MTPESGRSSLSSVLSSFLMIAYKEFLHVGRDRAALKRLLLIQMVQLVLAGGIDLRSRGIPVTIVDLDRTTESRMLVDRIKSTKALSVASMIDSPDEARDLIRAGRVQAAVVIPTDYQDKLVRRDGAALLAMVDGSDATASREALDTLGGLTARMNLDAEVVDPSGNAVGQPFTVTALTLFNPQGRTAFFLLPGLVVIQMTLLMSLTLGSFSRERDAGTLERLQMTPISPTGLLLGKMAPYWVVALADLVFLLSVMRWAFGVPIRGNPLLILLAGGLFMTTLLALGIFVTATATPARARTIFMMNARASVLLSGYLFPLNSIPKALLPLAYALPATHMIVILRSITLRDTDFVDLLFHFAYLVFAPVLLIAGGVPALRRKLMPET